MTLDGTSPTRHTLDARICDEVANALELAESGSRTLDFLVACALGEADLGSETVLLELLEAQVLPRHADLLGAGDCAPFTTSLDAALPGESIILSVFVPVRGRWSAVQRSGSGRETVGHGASEALARRIAVLKGLGADIRAAQATMRPTDGIAARQAVRSRAAANDAERHGDDEADPAELRRILRSLGGGGERGPRAQADGGDAGVAGTGVVADTTDDRDWKIMF